MILHMALQCLGIFRMVNQFVLQPLTPVQFLPLKKE